METLTVRQLNFANFYVESGNAYQSAIAAGYSHNYAKGNLIKLLENEKVKQYIKNKLEKKAVEINQEGKIRINPELYKALLNKFNGDVDFLNKNIEKVLIKEFLSENLNDDIAKKINRRNPFKKETRYAILKRAGFKCQSCGAKPQRNNDVKLEIDHVIPFSLGGKDTFDNLQVLCEKCNASKGNKFIINHNINWLTEA